VPQAKPIKIEGRKRKNGGYQSECGERGKCGGTGAMDGQKPKRSGLMNFGRKWKKKKKHEKKVEKGQLS